MYISSFIGSLVPLSNHPVKIISMDSYNGVNLEPLKGTTLREIHMCRFNGSITALKNTMIEEIYMPTFSGDLLPLLNAPIKQIITKYIKSVDEFKKVQMIHYLLESDL